MKKIYLLLTAVFISAISFGQVEGDIIITEIMQNPNAVADIDGEFFEVYNTTASPIDLNGWTITDNGSNSHTISGSLIVPANAYIVLGVNSDMATNGGIPVDYSYGQDIGLSNSDDELILSTPEGTEIDRVEYDGGPNFPDPSGKSMNLDIESFSYTANDDGGNWCESTTSIGGQYATPGAANSSCSAPCDLILEGVDAMCDGFTSGTDTYSVMIDFSEGASSSYDMSVTGGIIGGDDPSSVASGTITITGAEEGNDIVFSINNINAGGSCDFSVEINSPECIPANCAEVGSVIFTEIMQNPDAVSDNVGEWFELYNTTGEDIDLEGWNIIDDDHSLYEEGFTFPNSLIIPAHGYIIIANNANSATNGGLPTPDFVYEYPTITIGNGTDGLTIQCSGTIIDIVVWDGGATFPDPTGASMSLKVDNLNANDNDDGANWETAVFSYGDGDLGTPGCSNDAACCDLILGAVEVVCDAITINDDTYTATVAFTNGSTSTYETTTTSGTIGGDDPSSVASGTIIITGITEGTDIVVTVDNSAIGGECNLVAEITSPVCFPANCETVGSVIFTEIMQNPSSVGDDMGEWFELYNTTDSDIDLQGWDIIDDNHTLAEEGFTFPNSIIIPAGGYLLIANNGDEATNGGLPTPDFVYVNGFPFLGNGTDGITIQCSGSVIDEVIWDDGATFPDPSGASMSLKMEYLNGTDNDDGMNWETVEFIYGDGDFGTPGNANNEQISIKENEIEGLSIFPNPVIDGTIQLRSQSGSGKEIRIYDIYGKLIYETTITGTSAIINIGNLSSGIYLIKVMESSKTALRRLVVE
jgi:hypothetical protein